MTTLLRFRNVNLSPTRQEGTRGRGGIAPLILGLWIRWRLSGQFHAPGALLPWHEAPDTHKIQGGALSSVHVGKEETFSNYAESRCRWPRGLRRRSTAVRLLRLWIRIPPGAWMFVCCECFVLSGRGLCDALITRSEESYRLWCVVVWSRNLKNEEATARVRPQRQRKQTMLKMSRSSVHNLVAQTRRHQGFVHPCFTVRR